MKSFLHSDYHKHFSKLPKKIQEQAKKCYERWKENPKHPSLHFKRINSVKAFYSIRIGKDWRVVGYLENGDIYWFWIGSHADYNLLISQL